MVVGPFWVGPMHRKHKEGEGEGESGGRRGSERRNGEGGKRYSEPARGKAHKAVPVHVDAQRIDRCHGDVDAQVELVAVDEERVRKVLLDNNLAVGREIAQGRQHFDAYVPSRPSRACPTATMFMLS